MVIKPATSKAKCSYVDMLQARPDLCQEVAMSTVFVSYAWKYPFMQVLETVARAFPPETTFLWFDVVTVNQHTSSTVTLPMWLATFGTALSSIGEVVFVFKNWRRPVNTTRSWCVFEMVVTARIGVKSQVLFLPGEEDDFSAAMLANELSLGDFLTIFGSVNVEKAEAFKEEDRLEILTQLHTEGTQRVNDLAMLPLKQWMLKEASRVCELASKEGGGKYTAYAAVGALCQGLGMLDDALEWLGKAVDAAQVNGEDENVLAVLLNNRGGILRNQGKYEEALIEYNRVAEIWTRTLGPEDLNIATLLNNMAEVYRLQERNDEALPKYREAVEIWRRVLGNGHPNVATGLNNLGLVLKAQGLTEEALAMHTEALAIDRRALGNEHPDVATDLNNLAGALRDLGRLEEAVVVFKESLDLTKRALGDDHPDVATRLNGLAVVLWSVDNSSQEAARLGQEAVAVAERSLGPDHPRTLKYKRDWA
jgi:tetratricopeptide (TPR) repeat protein